MENLENGKKESRAELCQNVYMRYVDLDLGKASALIQLQDDSLPIHSPDRKAVTAAEKKSSAISCTAACRNLTYLSRSHGCFTSH